MCACKRACVQSCVRASADMAYNTDEDREPSATLVKEARLCADLSHAITIWAITIYAITRQRNTPLRRHTPTSTMFACRKSMCMCTCPYPSVCTHLAWSAAHVRVRMCTHAWVRVACWGICACMCIHIMCIHMLAVGQGRVWPMLRDVKNIFGLFGL